MNEFPEGSIWTHIRDQNQYIIVETCITKIGEDTSKGENGWIPSVIYTPYGDASKVYVRDQECFRNKFSRES